MTSVCVPAVAMSTGEEIFILTKEAVPRRGRRGWDRGPRSGRRLMAASFSSLLC